MWETRLHSLCQLGTAFALPPEKKKNKPWYVCIWFFSQTLCHVWLFVSPWTAAHKPSLSFTISRVCSDLCPLSWWCHPTISSSFHPVLLLPSIFPGIRVFSNELALRIRWPKYWSFSFNISPSNEYPGLISFRIDWFDLLAVQGTLKSLLQHHNSKASIPHCSALFMVQLSHPYMTTGKPELWRCRPVSGKWCLCFLICCLGLS